jgi:CMP-N,N'-diacetyllegionaminic acid synthase
MNILAIIPARGGSKEIPRKNIKIFGGKPLISYSIESAMKSKCITRIIVSTEDLEIRKISMKYGAETITRPPNLAGDDSATIDVILHSLNFLKENENYVPDIVVLLQPTSPLRLAEDIDDSIERFINNDCDSVISVCKLDTSPYWSLKIVKNYLKPAFGEKYLESKRQDLPNLYVLNGSIFISTPKILKKFNSFQNEKTIAYLMPPERSVDIDTELDFIVAEFLMKKSNNYYE